MTWKMTWIISGEYATWSGKRHFITAGELTFIQKLVFFLFKKKLINRDPMQRSTNLYNLLTDGCNTAPQICL